MTMRAGKLTERVDIERSGGATNENGEALPDSWVLHARVWADVEFINGVKHVVSGATRSSAVASVRIRYRVDIDATMRVRYLGRVFDIVAVLPNRGAGRLDLSVKTGEMYVSAGDRPE